MNLFRYYMGQTCCLSISLGYIDRFMYLDRSIALDLQLLFRLVNCRTSEHVSKYLHKHAFAQVLYLLLYVQNSFRENV